MSQVLDTLWYTRAPNPTPLGLAAQLGWFIEEFHGEGIKVFTMDESRDPDVRNARQDHHLTNSIRQGGNVPAIWAKARGAATRVIGLNWLDEYQGIISRRGSGVLAPGDLRDRRVGLPSFSNRIESHRAEALHGFLVALEVGGLQPSQIEFVDIALRWPDLSPQAADCGPYGEYELLVQALLKGEVDAIYVKGDRGLRATHEAGAHMMLDIGQHPDPLVRAHNGTPRPITVDQSLLDNHPQVAARFLARVAAVGPWAERHPGETLSYVSRQTKGAEEWVRAAYGGELHLRLGTDLDAVSIRALDVHKAFLLKWGFIQKDFDTEAWIDDKPLVEARRLAQSSAVSLSALA